MGYYLIDQDLELNLLVGVVVTLTYLYAEQDGTTKQMPWVTLNLFTEEDRKAADDFLIDGPGVSMCLANLIVLSKYAY